MRKLLPLILAILLLAGCQGGGAEASFPPPASSQPEQPAPPPDSEISVQAVVEWLSDENHHQFKIDWADLWVTMELLPGQRDGEREIQVDIWSLEDLDEPMQTIRDYIEENVFGWTQVADVNFDGHLDFGYMHYTGNQPNYWNFWLWDAGQGRFVAEPGLSEISAPVFHGETQTISGFARDGWAGLAGTSTIHRWIDGQLTCVRRVVSAPTEINDEVFQFVVEDWVDGQLEEVLRQEVPVSNEGIIFELREKWEDPLYTGEE